MKGWLDLITEPVITAINVLALLVIVAGTVEVLGKLVRAAIPRKRTFCIERGKPLRLMQQLMRYGNQRVRDQRINRVCGDKARRRQHS